MSIRTWLYVATLGLILAASGQAQGQDAAEDQPSQQETATDAEQEGTANDETPPDYLSALKGIETTIRDLIVEEDEIAEQSQNEREQRDLYAQESMANSAELMFYATGATVILTAFALWAIIRTLHHTRRAADYTSDMLAEAKRTTSAMSRAWIKAEITVNGVNEIEPEGDAARYTYDIDIRIDNIGNSPAINVHTNVGSTDDLSATHSTARQISAECIASHDKFAENSGLSVFPGQGYVRHWSPTVLDRTGNRYIIVVVNYQTIYDSDLHQTAVVCGIGWNGMSEKPENIETATYDWAGGFAT